MNSNSFTRKGIIYWPATDIDSGSYSVSGVFSERIKEEN
jgi:hypothetical protein